MPFVVQDEVLAPYNVISIVYSGANPLAVYKRIASLLQVVFQIKGKDIFEPDFRWDSTEDPRGFYIRVNGEKGFDKFTKLTVFVKLEGGQPVDPNKVGKLKIELSGKLETKFPSETVIQNAVITPLLWFYYHTFYKNIRRKYLEISKKYIMGVESELRKMLRLEQRVTA